jgi:hypothetical protein
MQGQQSKREISGVAWVQAENFLGGRHQTWELGVLVDVGASKVAAVLHCDVLAFQ